MFWSSCWNAHKLSQGFSVCMLLQQHNVNWKGDFMSIWVCQNKAKFVNINDVDKVSVDFQICL